MHLKLNCTWRQRREFVTCKSSNVHGGGDESSSHVIEVKMCIEAGTRVRHA